MAKDRYSTLGAKLGPRLAHILAQSQIHTEQKMLHTRHKLGMSIFNAASDMIGGEINEVAGDFFAKLAKEHEGEEHVKRTLKLIADGHGQASAILGSMVLGGVTGNALTTIFSNELYPLVADVVRTNPNLPPSPETIAALVAHHLINPEDGLRAAEGQGRPYGWFEAEVQASQTWLDPSIVLELLRRNIIGDDAAVYFLERIGMAGQAVPEFLKLQRQHLAPADAALALLRNAIGKDKAYAAAHVAGLDSEDFETMVEITGEPPPVEELLSLWRRNKISDGKLAEGIRQSRVRDEWVPVIKEMAIIPPSPQEALNAYLQGQISRQEAEKRFKEGGGDMTWFQHAFDSEGAAPTPVMLGEMANRGIIPWEGQGPGVKSFHQGFLEGPWRNKWLEPMRKLAQYYPPPRTVTTLLKDGAIGKKEALKLFRDQGLSEQLAEAYVVSASGAKIKKQKDLAAGQISELYRDQAIDAATARGMWEDLGYDHQEAHFLLVLAEFARVQRYNEAAISTVHSRYVGHVIDKATASGALDRLNVPPGQRDSLLGLWDLEREVKVKRLTAAEVKAAVKKELLSVDHARERLERMGYPHGDAEIYLKL